MTHLTGRFTRLLTAFEVCLVRAARGQIVERNSIREFAESLKLIAEPLVGKEPDPSLRTAFADLRLLGDGVGSLKASEYVALAHAGAALLNGLRAVRAQTESAHSALSPDSPIAAEEESLINRLVQEFPEAELKEIPCEGCEGCPNRFCERRSNLE
jgi:hypothetical protein